MTTEELFKETSKWAKEDKTADKLTKEQLRERFLARRDLLLRFAESEECTGDRQSVATAGAQQWQAFADRMDELIEAEEAEKNEN